MPADASPRMAAVRCAAPAPPAACSCGRVPASKLGSRTTLANLRVQNNLPIPTTPTRPFRRLPSSVTAATHSAPQVMDLALVPDLTLLPSALRPTVSLKRRRLRLQHTPLLLPPTPFPLPKPQVSPSGARVTGSTSFPCPSPIHVTASRSF